MDEEGIPEFSGQTAEEELNNNFNNSAINPTSPLSNARGLNNLDFPTVLHFLHLEWRRFESEKNQWELERNELKVNTFSHVIINWHSQKLHYLKARNGDSKC